MRTMKFFKKATTVLAVGLAALGCQAEYLPFIEEGKSWIMAEESGYGNEHEICSYRKIEVTGSMEISGKDFFILEIREGKYDDKGNWITYLGPFSASLILLNEENGVISIAIPEDKGYWFRELFSLDMKPEEWHPEDPTRPFKTTVEINGEQRAAIYAGNALGHIGWIVEGIGASVNFWDDCVPTLAYAKFLRTYMVECRKDDKVLFTQEDFQKLPIPGNNGIEMPSADKPLSEIYDLQGNSVSEMQQGEIYVKDGKKVMARE